MRDAGARKATDARTARKRRHRRVAALVVVVLLLTGVVLGARRLFGRHDGAAPTVTIPGITRAPARAPTGVRIRVEVVNTTTTRGLARRATRLLRDRGFDVVGVGTAAGQATESTIVVDRSGHPEWARLVAEALGGARIETRPDTSRYLDLTVLLGRAWTPPAESLHP